jgi:hypothetical protein
MQNSPESIAAQRDRFRSLNADETLTAIDSCTLATRRAEVDVLVLAAHWADLHGQLDREISPALPGSERLIQFGGDGTPEVAEFAPAELGAVLEISTNSATALIAAALDLRHRLPSLWQRVCDHEVKPWMAREIAELTRPLSRDAAHVVDARVARWADRLTWGRLRAYTEAAIIAADPAAAERIVEAAASQQGVWLGQSNEHGLKDIHIRTEAPNAIWFDATVDRLADSLGALGDDSDKEIRRARAVGIIAHPQQALDLLDNAISPAATEHEPTVDDPTADDPADHERSAPRSSRPKAILNVHIAHESITGAGNNLVARVEDVGAATLQQVKEWLNRCDVSVRPVLDPIAVAPVDGYEIPDRMRQAVHLMSPADAFPFASSVRRQTDLDHTRPYVPIDRGGGGGQTAIGNLAKLTRLHHRVKTHGRWRVKQPFPGILIWRSPYGRLFLVDHTGTRRLPDSA